MQMGGDQELLSTLPDTELPDWREHVRPEAETELSNEVSRVICLKQMSHDLLIYIVKPRIHPTP